MNNSFSLQRVVLLLQRYFLENVNKELIQWGFVIFLFAALDVREFVILMMFLTGMISAKRIHKALFVHENALHLILLPAKRSEKIASAFILNTIYHFFVVSLAYVIGNVLVIVLYHKLINIPIPINWDLFQVTSVVMKGGAMQTSTTNVFFELFGYFALSQSFYTLGLFYFDRFPNFKTTISIIGTVGFLILIQCLMFIIVWDVKDLSNAIIPTIILLRDSTLPWFVDLFLRYGTYIFIPLVWVVSYLRMRELQQR